MQTLSCLVNAGVHERVERAIDMVAKVAKVVGQVVLERNKTGRVKG